MEKRMKKIQLAMLTVSIIGMSATAVNAQSKFEGFYGQAGIGYESVTPSLSYGNVNITQSGTPIASLPIASSISNSNSFIGTVTAGYMFAVTKNFLLGIGAEYSPIAGSKANYSASNATIGTVNGQWNKENSYNIFLSPATAIGNDGLLYGKVGYTGTSIKSQYTNGGSSTTNNLTGYSLGFGYKQIISAGFYGFGEVNYASYSNLNINDVATSGVYRATQTVTISANAMNVLVGIGYKF
jgi:hypothetical protein